ncbi:TPA: hypothetical protein HA251_07850 [Candidatus Woesearchaeota archaeon]|nr:hypothetical protein [Candidatus Woesearchaeota archaeon]
MGLGRLFARMRQTREDKALEVYAKIIADHVRSEFTFAPKRPFPVVHKIPWFDHERGSASASHYDSRTNELLLVDDSSITMYELVGHYLFMQGRRESLNCDYTFFERVVESATGYIASKVEYPDRSDTWAVFLAASQRHEESLQRHTSVINMNQDDSLLNSKVDYRELDYRELYRLQSLVQLNGSIKTYGYKLYSTLDWANSENYAPSPEEYAVASQAMLLPRPIRSLTETMIGLLISRQESGKAAYRAIGYDLGESLWQLRAKDAALGTEAINTLIAAPPQGSFAVLLQAYTLLDTHAVPNGLATHRASSNE